MALRRAKNTPQKKKIAVPTKTELAYRYVQFSKWITIYVLAFWGIYRLAQLVVVVVAPNVDDTMVKLVSGIDTMAIFFGGFYTTNSITEKALVVHKDVQKYMYTSSKDSDSSNGNITQEDADSTENG